MSRFDQWYRSLLITKFFTKGWGSPENMRRLLEFRKVISCRQTCMQLVDKDHPVQIDKEYDSGDCHILDGHFVSPLHQVLPGVMPEAVSIARFQVVLPHKWKDELKPVCIHLAGTGDHGYWRRRTLMARPLVKEAQIGSILLENPYYGQRKPKDQLRSSLQNVSDLFVMGGALVLESIALLHWCEKMGFGPLGITGISMGGHMASAAACSWPKPLSLVPLLSWSTASQCFTQGVLSGAVSWDQLQSQFSNDSVFSELSQLVHSPEQKRWQHLFEMGQKFAQDYPQSIDEMELLHQSHRTAHPVSELPVIGPVVNILASKLYDPSVLRSKKRLKELSLDSPYLPNKSLSVEVVHFMRGVMDECTHLAHFDRPIDSELTIIVAARQDAYVPRDRVTSLEELWPGCEVRYIDQGHVSAFLFKQNVFRKAIRDSFQRQIDKYCSGGQSKASTIPSSHEDTTKDSLTEQDSAVSSATMRKASNRTGL